MKSPPFCQPCVTDSAVGAKPHDAASTHTALQHFDPVPHCSSTLHPSPPPPPSLIPTEASRSITETFFFSLQPAATTNSTSKTRVIRQLLQPRVSSCTRR